MTSLILLFSLKECALINVLPLRYSWRTLGKDQIFDVKETYTTLTYTSESIKFQQLDGICSYVMALSERKVSLPHVVKNYQERGANTNKIIINASPNGQVRTRENPE